MFNGRSFEEKKFLIRKWWQSTDKHFVRERLSPLKLVISVDVSFLLCLKRKDGYKNSLETKLTSYDSSDSMRHWKITYYVMSLSTVRLFGSWRCNYMDKNSKIDRWWKSDIWRYWWFNVVRKLNNFYLLVPWWFFFWSWLVFCPPAS